MLSCLSECYLVVLSGLFTRGQDAEEKVSLPAEIIISAEAPLNDLINFVYPSFEASVERDGYFASRAILAPYNDSVDAINETCLGMFPGSLREYRSIDSVADEDAATHFPPELLNQLDAPNFPIHLLRLKVGMPVVLLRNINPPRLCNGTRLIILAMGENVLRCKIAAGQFTGDEILLPRIPLIPSNADLPVSFKRLQFPVKPSFCLTIHKSQGQSLDTVGIDLSVGCFTHGQLYTALSRAKNAANVRVRIPGTRTRNVVFPEVLTEE
ncbi:hypothetical protein BOX15_Mlig024103g1 [Macrostomum lignano]|uniref:Uncharacterized protein n=1 Tax=Macrostomum lignano TaxID=282301 RepID=A0A267FKI5_9PLAT|nr:hypothetical protein BOX15_Mlig024103g1 [Macrostomum lignano]